MLTNQNKNQVPNPLTLNQYKEKIHALELQLQRS